MGTHALLSPSSANRWLHCTASPLLEAKETDRNTSYAQEGTLAHAMCAQMLKAALREDVSKEDAEIKQLGEFLTGEMGEHTTDYYCYVCERYAQAKADTKDAKLIVEQRLDLGEWTPGCFGTADALIIADRQLEIIDFKYGKGVRVSATDNPQMKIYALGAISAYGFDYTFDRVRMTIYQPRLGNIDSCEMSVADLVQWAEDTLKPKAQEAMDGGKQEPGEWCQFCKVRAKCKALAAMAEEECECDPKLCAKTDVERILPKLATIKAWATAFEEYVLEQALNGTKYEGYKLVEGRSNRKYADPLSIAKKLTENGITGIYQPQELKGLTEMEKLVGKKRFSELCGEWIVKPQGKPTLVPMSDKRQEINDAKSDFADMI